MDKSHKMLHLKFVYEQRDDLFSSKLPYKVNIHHVTNVINLS